MANFSELFMTSYLNGIGACTVLDDAKNAGLRLQVGSVKVTHANLMAVSQAIRDEQITVEVYSGITGDAEYRPDLDVIRIGSVATMSDILTGDPLSCSLLVHEAVHAANDIFMSGQSILRPENEAAAYLAQAYYLRKHGWEKGPNGNGGTAHGTGYLEKEQANELIYEMQSILGFAMEIVDKLLEAYVDLDADLATQEETKLLVSELKKAIARMKPYSDSTTFWSDKTSYNGLAKPKVKPKKKVAKKKR
jgi:hypothetical protein